ncbi:MAG: hypothetical protein KAY32_17395, partial [Candidatus Eisenbacteria sp.]|nr:hypothetical protein [Candidatus Eisenbacteria bacterium]
DTIIVRDGTYNENVDVNTSLTIKSENGTETTIVQVEDSNDPVFEVTADYVTITGFMVTGTTGTAGISLKSATHCNISNNTVSNNVYDPTPNISLNNSVYVSPIVLGGGIAWDGTYWYTFDSGHVSSTERIYQHYLNGTLTGLSWDYTTYVQWPGGITFHDGYIYMSENDGGHGGSYEKIHKWTTDGVHINSWDISSYMGYPLAIDSDEDSLYVGDFDAPHSIHIFNISTMAHEGVILNTHRPYGFTLNYDCGWYLISDQHGSTDRLYQHYINGTSTGWSMPFSCTSIKLVGTVLAGIDDNYIYFYDANYSNNGCGIYLASSSNNNIYLNNFIKNTNNFYSHDSTNIWNSTS